MAFRIEVTEPTEWDIVEATEFIAIQSQYSAIRWNNELWILILSLGESAFQFPIISVAGEREIVYRAANHYSHRVIFRVDEIENAIFIVRVYHHARKPVTKEDLE